MKTSSTRRNTPFTISIIATAIVVSPLMANTSVPHIVRCIETEQQRSILDETHDSITRTFFCSIAQAKEQASFCEKQQDYAQAITIYHQATLQFKYETDFYLRLAQLYELAGQKNLAFATLDRALKYLPQHPLLHRALGTLYLSENQAVLSEFCFRRAHEYDPRDSMTISFLADALRMQNKNDEAIRLYNQALQGDPSNISAAAGLSKIYVATGKAHEAITLIERTLQYKENEPILHYNLGCALMQVGNSVGAGMAFRTALIYNPQYAHAYFKLMELHFKTGESVEAYKVFVQAWKQAKQH